MLVELVHWLYGFRSQNIQINGIVVFIKNVPLRISY